MSPNIRLTRFLQALARYGEFGANRVDLPLADNAENKTRQKARTLGLAMFGKGRWQITELGKAAIATGGHMADTIESLSVELEQQKANNAKLADLLRMVQRGLPDTESQIKPMTAEVQRTKDILDDAGRLLDEKRRNRPTK